jgi:hypothetical protein
MRLSWRNMSWGQDSANWRNLWALLQINIDWKPWFLPMWPINIHKRVLFQVSDIWKPRADKLCWRHHFHLDPMVSPWISNGLYTIPPYAILIHWWYYTYHKYIIHSYKSTVCWFEESIYHLNRTVISCQFQMWGSKAMPSHDLVSIQHTLSPVS